MDYKIEIYEQQRGNGSKWYKVAMAIKNSYLFGLIKVTDRKYLSLTAKHSIPYFSQGGQEYGHFFSDLTYAKEMSEKAINKELKIREANKIISYKQIQ